MKRFWLLALLMAGTLTAALSSPAFAAKSSDESSDNSSDMEDINSALGSMSAHMNDIDKKLGLTIFGDVRGRYAVWTQTQSAKTINLPTTQNPTITDKAVGRYRARIGAKEAFGDILGSLRLSTGGLSAGVTSNPNSENNTYANGFGDPAALIDLAYITYTPSWLDKHLMVTAGKMPNPLVNTPMTWDPDFNPEGACVELNWGDTKFRATYFDLANNNVGKAQPINAGPITNTGFGSDEYMANFQLEEMIKLDTDTNVDLTLGYEYVPYVTALAGGTNTGGYIGPTQALITSNTPAGAGMIYDFAKVIPDIQDIEGIAVVKHKIGDVPMKWTVHFLDNLDSFNVPNMETLAGPAVAKGTAQGYYSKWTNQYGFYLEGKAGDSGSKGAWQGVLAVSYVEPNAQLANLASDDANFTNTEYLYEQLGYGLEDHVQLLLSVWELQRVYYSYYQAAAQPFDNNALTTGGGTSQSPEFQIYADCVVGF